MKDNARNNKTLPRRSAALGRWGEEYAADFLLQRGWEIIGRNVRTKYGELDLIARKGEELVFFEVKTRFSSEFGMPEEAVSEKKKVHLHHSAESYLELHPELSDDWRVDVIAIRFVGQGRNPEVVWFENVLA